MIHKRGYRAVSIVATLLLAFSRDESAQAGFTVSLDSVTPIASGPYTGDFLWTYSASIASTDTIAASPGGNHFFQLYDFAGYVPGSATAPSGWTASAINFSPPPPPANIILLHGDSPTIPNLQFKYTVGTSLVGSTLVSGAVPGTFTAVSIYPSKGGVKDFTGQLARSSDGSLVASGGELAVPVPEPIALISTALGLTILGIGSVIRKRKAALAASIGQTG